MVLGGVSPRARAYVRKQATAVMEATCRIVHPSETSFDEDNLLETTGPQIKLYEGICRLWEVSGQGTVIVGDEHLHMQTTNLSIPWDAQLPNGLPMRGDEFVILSHPTDTFLVGRRGKLLDPVLGGELRATRRWVVQMQQDEDHGAHS